uniref:Collagen, type VI, alpha 3 n=1 Tax=Pygocentrus nattereri TaxID=42514 RepID=A0A3B4EGF3_PYGNA
MSLNTLCLCQISLSSQMLFLFPSLQKDVVFLLDGSDGTRKGFTAMLDFVQKVVEKLNVEENRDRVSVVQYSRDPETHFYLNTYSEETDVLDTIKTLRHRGGRTLNTGSALQYVRDNVFTSSAGSRSQQGVPQILILLSGSRSNDNVDTPASALKESGVLILGVGTRNSSREIQRIVSDPSYAQSISEISDLPAVQQQFLSTLASTVSYVTPVKPTVIGKTDCHRYFQVARTAIYVVFLLDGSDGTRDSFPAMRDFVQRMVDRLNVSDRRDRVSVVQFSREPEAHFYLNTYTTKESVLNTVRGLRHRGGRPLNTGAALQYVRDNVFTASSGSRRLEGVPQLLILLSGGRSFDNIDMPASSLKELGVLTFAVGSRGSDSRELQKISYDPSSALSVTDFANFPTVQEQLFSRINTVHEETKTVSPTQIVEPEAQRRDVVFLLDGSDGTRSGFPAMKDFVLRVMEKLNVAEDKDRVSVVQFSRDPETHFYLNTYTRKDDIVDTVSVLRHKGGRPLNTGAALQYVRDNVFTASSGSRRLEGVPQILILLSGARSFDNVDVPASALKDLGVLIFTIGSRGSDSRELQKISHEPKYALSVSDFTELPNVQEQLVNTVETDCHRYFQVSQGPKKDVVFVIDGSDGVGREFPIIQEFVRRVVENLNVGENKIRVGVVQYGDTPRPDIYLNSHKTKEGVLTAIKELRQQGGRQRNLGAAMTFVIREVLDSRRGGRKQEGVPQFLVVISGGRSTDNIRTPANTLKQTGIVPFSIGTRDVDPQELQVISYVPSFAYTVDDLPGLYTVQDDLITTVTELSNEELARLQPRIFYTNMTVPPTSNGGKKDVVFLVDGTTTMRSEFPAIRDMIQRVVEKLDVGLDKVRVSVVQYSEDPKREFLLNEHSTKEEVLQAVRRMRSKGGRVLNTGQALNWVSKNIYQRSAGSRIEERVPQFLILVTGGKSNDDVSEPAKQLKLNVVAPLAVGSNNADLEELKLISLGSEHAYTIRDFRQLPSVEQQLLVTVNTMNSEEIIRRLNLGKKDIIFLVDGSDNVGQSGIAHIRDFIIKIVQQLNVRPDQVRVAVVQYAERPKTEFSLLTHDNKQSVISAVKRLRHMGGRGTNLAEAIEYVIRNELKASAGARGSEASQHLVVLTGGRSTSDVSAYGPLLKGAEVNCIGIGAGAADSRQLRQIATTPDDVLHVPTFPALPTIQDPFIARLNGSISVEPPIDEPTPSLLPNAKTADIVFLVDGSINLGRSNFKEVMEFIINLIDLFFTENDNLRIGLASYAADVTDVFYLNTHNNKDEIITAIGKAEYKGGRGINTGNAIKHIQRAHFVKDRGSRKDEGVPQILMLVTGGRSQDDGKAAALGLKSTGVRLYAIGVGDIEDELNDLGSEPTTVARASNVQELSELNEQILETLDDEIRGKLCVGGTEPAKVCNLDVLVGFDVSSQNIFVAQRSLESKMSAILQRITQMQAISCSPNQAPSIQVGILAMDSASEPVQLDFTDSYTQLMESFRALRSRGPFVLNGKTIDAYIARFRNQPSGRVKVVIHLTDGLDAQYNIMKQRVEQMQTAGINAFVLVALERVPRFEEAVLLEFGRGFRYTRPLRVNLMDLDYELLEELDNIAERECCSVPCKCTGQRGDRGSVGLPGPKGLPGGQGYRGHPGDEGGPGERGPLGVNGTQGFQGCPGPRGVKGARGYNGEKGETGEIGLDGINGEEGKSGVAGPPGDRGNPGRRGPKGAKGQAGDVGQTGIRGDPVCVGQFGQFYSRLSAGESGTKGAPGPKGNSGQRGVAGGIGGPGQKGEVGHPGPYVSTSLSQFDCAQECPLYPTELAFALDASSGVSRGSFNNMRDAVVRLVRNITITESNCPRGARVALTLYNSEVTTEIRFADALKKRALVERVEGLQALQTNKQRSLETAMNFLAQNTFKRVRSGFLVRKVAVFFVNGAVRPGAEFSAAALRLYDAGIASVFLVSREDRALVRALQLNNTALAQVLVLPPPGSSEYNSVITKIMNCHICLDFCAPDQICDYEPPISRGRRASTTDLDIDMAFILDSSESTWPNVFTDMKQYIAQVVDNLEISTEPAATSHQARVALVQHAPYEYLHNGSGIPISVAFGLTDHKSAKDIQSFLMDKVYQLEGGRALAAALESTVEHVFEKAPYPRHLKVLMLLVTGPVEEHEERLVKAAIEAKCKGYFIVVIRIGKQISAGDARVLAQVASEPSDVFYKNADGPAGFYDSHLQIFAQLLPKYLSMENVFYMSPNVSKNCQWYQSDQPGKSPFRSSHLHEKSHKQHQQQEVHEQKHKELNTEDLHLVNVTATGFTLSWVSDDPKATHEVTVTHMRDQRVMLQLNTTDHQFTVHQLEAAQTYHVVVNSRNLKGQVTRTYKGVITTTKVHVDFNLKYCITIQTESAELRYVPGSEVTGVVSTAPLSKPETGEWFFSKSNSTISELSDPCSHDFDSGLPCKDYEAKWYFDKKNGFCSQFWYGGCGGNENRFETEAQCLRRCKNTGFELFRVVDIRAGSSLLHCPLSSGVDICKLPKQEGACAKFVLKWFYDSVSNSCTRFWYGGCGGNQNRFETQEECEKACGKGETRRTPVPAEQRTRRGLNWFY